MEENKTPNKSEKDIIKENMLILYKAYQDEEKNTVDEISYYKQIVLQSEKSPIMYGLQDIYPVNIKEPEKFYGNRILLYQNGTPIAMIDENSNIKFSNEYLEQMKSLNPSIYALLHSMNGKHYELPQIQEVSGKLPDINSKQEVEDLVNKYISMAIPVEKLEMKKEDAVKMGAEAMFMDRYADIVTVYKIGDVSLEVCGGPHVKNTSELGKFKIKKEESSSAGVRRIKAVLEN